MYSCVGRELSLTELLRRQEGHCCTVNVPREMLKSNLSLVCLNSWEEKTAISILTSM